MCARVINSIEIFDKTLITLMGNKVDQTKAHKCIYQTRWATNVPCKLIKSLVELFRKCDHNVIIKQKMKKHKEMENTRYFTILMETKIYIYILCIWLAGCLRLTMRWRLCVLHECDSRLWSESRASIWMHWICCCWCWCYAAWCF